MAKYNRILLKLSGEAMAGPASFGIDPDRAKDLAAEIAAIGPARRRGRRGGGGGNIFSRPPLAGEEYGPRDGRSHGYACHVINSLALQDALEQWGSTRAS